jgi:dihydrofolate synthase/folylpolyglutamate synthase
MNPRNLDDWLEYAERSHSKDIDMGLTRVRKVADRMGLLEPGATRFVIVAGTNGKGSTTVAIAGLLLEMGFKTGATLSPHVHRFNERVQIDGAQLDDERLCEAFAAVDAARGDIALTYFEFATLVALESFRREAVDVAVLEVGLGGRLDAFNIVSADIAVVTSIGLDHQAFLGDDLEQIGREKAGVFRERQTVVLGAVTRSVRETAEKLHCQIFAAGEQFEVTEQQHFWSYRSDSMQYDQLPRGALAPANWSMALTVVQQLAPPSRAQLEAALGRARLPGRLERWQCAGRLVVLDVAHNPAGARFLQQQLDRIFPDRQFFGILGMLSDKMPAQVVAELRCVSDWLLVPTIGTRGQDAQALLAQLEDHAGVEVTSDFESALQQALSSVAEGSGILVCGSFSVVEQARNWLTNSSASGLAVQELT